MIRGQARVLPRPPRGQIIHARGRLREPCHAHATLPNLSNDRVTQLDGNLFARQPPADTQEIAAGTQRKHRAIGNADPVGNRSHLETIADGEPVEAELPSQQAGHDLRADRRRDAVDRRDHDVRAHHRPHARRYRSPKRLQGARVRVFVHDREGEVGVERRGAVAGKVLGARSHAGLLQALDPGRRLPCDRAWPGPESAHSDDGVDRVAVHIGHRRQVEVDAGGREVGAHRAGHRASQPRVVHSAEREVARV